MTSKFNIPGYVLDKEVDTIFSWYDHKILDTWMSLDLIRL
jgi:hypothetical protein